MIKRLQHVVVIILFKVLIVSGSLTAGTPEFTRQEMQELIASVQPEVEKVTGRSFKAGISVSIKTPDEILDILKKEADWRYKGVSLPVRDKNRTNYLNQINHLLSRLLMGKLAIGQNKIYIVPENIRRLNDMLTERSILSKRFLKILLIHELVHVQDDQYYDLRSFFTGVKTHSDMLVREAVVEGHAQYITKKVMARLGQKKDFEKFKEVVTSPPSRETSLKAYMKRVFSSNLRFSYKQGHAFWKTLHKKNVTPLPERVFQNPPSSSAMISTPEYYLNPDTYNLSGVKSKIDTMVQTVKKTFSTDKWSSRALKIQRHKLKTALSLLPAEAAVRGLQKFQTGKVLMVKSKQENQSVYSLSFLAFDHHAAARQFFALEKEVLDAKKKKFQSQSVQFVGESREKKKFGDTAFINVYDLKIRGQEVTTTTLVILKNQYVFELNLTVQGNEEDRSEALMKKGKACLDALHSVLR